MEIIKCESNKDKNFYFNMSTIKSKKYSSKLEKEIVNIYPDVMYQELIGFGGAITESSAYCYSLLSENKKQEFINDYFSDINYSFCRLPIGSCDFSLNSYSYANKHDLSDFSIEKDLKYIVPFIKDALNVNPNLRFIASPWSPPKFAKNNKMLILGGKLLDKYKQTYADYLVKYINAYKDLGINIDFITVQNEPNAIQIWESCLFSPQEEADFVVNYLYPTFKANNIDTKIIIYDHNKEKLYSRAVQEFSVPGVLNASSGLAFHWYSGNHYENIAKPICAVSTKPVPLFMLLMPFFPAAIVWFIVCFNSYPVIQKFVINPYYESMGMMPNFMDKFQMNGIELPQGFFTSGRKR